MYDFHHVHRRLQYNVCNILHRLWHIAFSLVNFWHDSQSWCPSIDRYNNKSAHQLLSIRTKGVNSGNITRTCPLGSTCRGAKRHSQSRGTVHVFQTILGEAPLNVWVSERELPHMSEPYIIQHKCLEITRALYVIACFSWHDTAISFKDPNLSSLDEFIWNTSSTNLHGVYHARRPHFHPIYKPWNIYATWMLLSLVDMTPRSVSKTLR